MTNCKAQHLENLPNEILSLPRFLRTRQDNPKAPLVSKWQLPENQKLYSQLRGTVGFVAATETEESLVFFDFDHVIDDAGNFTSPVAGKWFERISASGKYFAELSQSGHGLHMFARPTKGKFDKVVGKIYFDDEHKSFLEVFYRTNKFCLVTGNLFRCEPKATVATGEDADTVFQAVIAELEKKNKAQTQEPHTRTTTPVDASNTPRAIENTDTPEYDLFRAPKMLDAINPAALSDTEWLAVISSCKNIGLPYDTVDAFNRRDSERYNERENLERWNSTTDPSYNIETLHGIAKCFNFEEAEAQREWYQLNPELSTKQERKEKRTRDLIADCPADLILPENFIWTKQGITQLVPSKKDSEEFKYLPVTKTPIVITKNFANPQKALWSLKSPCVFAINGNTLLLTAKL